MALNSKSHPPSARAGKRFPEAAPVTGRRISDPKVSWNLDALTAQVTQKPGPKIAQRVSTAEAISSAPDPKIEELKAAAEGSNDRLGQETRVPPLSARREMDGPANREALYQQRLRELKQKALDIMSGNRAHIGAPKVSSTEPGQLESAKNLPRPTEANHNRASGGGTSTRAPETRQSRSKRHASPAHDSPVPSKQAKGHLRPFSSLLKESQDRLANIHRLLDAATEDTVFGQRQGGDEIVENRNPVDEVFVTDGEEIAGAPGWTFFLHVSWIALSWS
jgi:hypothetical protein